MSHAYRAVGWNRQKRIYDLMLAGGVVAYLAVFSLANLVVRPGITAETLLIRAFGTCALLLLHVVLSIGPLCRLDTRFLPLLYNRRHLGVTMFLTALAHGLISIVQFHTLGDLNPLVSVLTSNGRYESIAWFPFQPLGLAALVILFLMAATSHDFWLTNLTPPVWKALHMSVYVAYALVVIHVALGVLQYERHPALAGLVLIGLVWVLGLHLVAGFRERAVDREPKREPTAEGFVVACRVDEIPDNRARIVALSGERIAVFRYDGKISALSNVCQHQNGPLGEGMIVDGCVTCPWHGFQYLPANGSSPPPFTEMVPTFRVRVDDGRVYVHPRPNPPGTPVEPAACGKTTSRSAIDLYIGFIAATPGWVTQFFKPRLLGLLGTALGVAVLVTALQRPFADSAFEYQEFRPFTGTVVLDPYPMLLIERPGLTSDAAPVSVVPLTAFGKHGADAVLTGLSRRRVEVEAELIHRDGQTMLQLRDGSVRAIFGGGSDERLEYIGEAILRGEIVDSKCYLGVMKPGRDKPHRACAALCIRGGVPPMLLVEEANGAQHHFLLMNADGESIGRDVLDLVAEPVRITGQEYRLADLRILATDPRTIERLP